MCYKKGRPGRGLTGGQQTAHHLNRRDRAAAGADPRRPGRAAYIIRAQGERTSRRFIEFFTANIRNRNTRMAYARAVKQFFDWCDKRKVELREIEPLNVAAYIEQLGAEASKPTVKQHLAAIRKLSDYLTTGGILESTQQIPCAGPSTWSSAARPRCSRPRKLASCWTLSTRVR